MRYDINSAAGRDDKRARRRREMTRRMTVSLEEKGSSMRPGCGGWGLVVGLLCLDLAQQL